MEFEKGKRYKMKDWKTEEWSFMTIIGQDENKIYFIKDGSSKVESCEKGSAFLLNLVEVK